MKEGDLVKVVATGVPGEGHGVIVGLDAVTQYDEGKNGDFFFTRFYSVLIGDTVCRIRDRDLEVINESR